jgi:hypothetical protein
MNQSQANPEPAWSSGQTVGCVVAEPRPNDRSVAGSIPRLEIVPDSRKSANAGMGNRRGV